MGCWIEPNNLLEAMAFLAKWFHFQPSEIVALEISDFLDWVEAANKQAKAMNDGIRNT